MIKDRLLRNVSLRPYTTLRAGGPAEFFLECRTGDEVADAARHAQDQGLAITVIGGGSNVLPSDKGVSGLVLLNLASRVSVANSGEVVAETGANFQDVFLKTAQAGLAGLSFAVGIPGSIGGALVSNAGAYRNNIENFVLEVEATEGGVTEWRSRDWMQFSYRDSIFRDRGLKAVMSRVHLKLPAGSRKEIYDDAREYQRQRISKQPPSPSAGSFFKNVNDKTLAADLPGLSDGMRAAGVVPAGFLIEACGLKGYRVGGAMMGARHANFLLNVGNASASELRSVAKFAQQAVRDKFGVELEEEVLYIGDWS